MKFKKVKYKTLWAQKTLLLFFLLFLGSTPAFTLHTGENKNTTPSSKDNISSYLDVSLQKQTSEGEISQAVYSFASPSENSVRLQRRTSSLDHYSSRFYKASFLQSFFFEKNPIIATKYLSLNKRMFYSSALRYHVFELRRIVV